MAAALAILWTAALVGGPRRRAGTAPPGRLIAAALAKVCPAGSVTRNAKGRPTGCRVCPRQTDVRDLPGSWTLKEALTGRFLSAHGRNLLMTGWGCEPHMLNWGGAFLFALARAGPPRLLRYYAGLSSVRWRAFRMPKGRDLLLGRAEGGAQGTRTQSVIQLAFRTSGRFSLRTLFATASVWCAEASGGPPTPPVRSQLRRWRIVGRTGAVPSGLLATVTWGRAPRTEAAAACTSWRMPQFPVKTYHLRFRYDGQFFLPTPATERLLQRKFSPSLSLWVNPLFTR